MVDNAKDIDKWMDNDNWHHMWRINICENPLSTFVHLIKSTYNILKLRNV